MQSGQINFNESKFYTHDNLVGLLPLEPQVTSKNPVNLSCSALLKISSIFPFNLISDTVIIDHDKVNIISKDILGMGQISSVLVEDISHVDINTGLVTASLHLIDSTNERNPIDILAHNLNISDALKARMLIQGLIAVKKHSLKLPNGNPLDYEKEAEQLGNGEETTFSSQSVETSTKISSIPKKEALPHYYGDLIRILLIIAGAVMLFTLPIFYNLTNMSLNVSILTILGLTILAGAMSPRYYLITFVESFISMVLFLIFENTAMNYFIKGASNYFALVNQVLASIFFVAT